MSPALGLYLGWVPHLHFLNLWVCVKEVLELGGVDILASTDDHILRAAHNLAEALLIHRSNVSVRKAQELSLTSASSGWLHSLTHSQILRKHLLYVLHYSRLWGIWHKQDITWIIQEELSLVGGRPNQVNSYL